MRVLAGDGDVDILEGAGAHHEALGGSALFGRAAVIAHPPLQPVGGEVVLDRGRREKRSRTQEIMPAAMPVAVLLDRAWFRDARLLAQARQGVIFAEDRDHRAAFAGFPDHRRRDARDIARHAKAFGLERRDMLGARAFLRVAELGHAPDPVAQRDEALLLGIDVPPNFFTVFHDRGTPFAFMRSVMQKIGPAVQRL
jgi:hypothetical protein